MKEKYSKFFAYNREKYENILDDPKSKGGKLLDGIILFLVVLFPFVLIFESLGTNVLIYAKELFIFDAFISSVFAIEYFYRLYKSKQKINFIYNPMRIIDLLSFLPFFLGFFAAGDFLKILRILRALRILRLMKKLPLTSGFINSLKDYIDEYRAVFTLYLIILFLGSFFVYYAEKDIVGTGFTSIPESLWWGLVTTATVGYGDVVPVTPLGKIIGSILVFLGPLLGGLISAVTVMVFMETSRNQERLRENHRGKTCPRCRNKNPKVANFCMNCGEDLIGFDEVKVKIDKIIKS